MIKSQLGKRKNVDPEKNSNNVTKKNHLRIYKPFKVLFNSVKSCPNLNETNYFRRNFKKKKPTKNLI